MTYWMGLLLKCLDDSGRLKKKHFNKNQTKIGVLDFRILNGGSIRELFN